MRVFSFILRRCRGKVHKPWVHSESRHRWLSEVSVAHEPLPLFELNALLGSRGDERVKEFWLGDVEG